MRDAVSSVSAVNNQTTLATLALDGKAVGVQLYGDEVNAPLMSFLASYGAKPLPVFPYRYAPAAETEAVAALVEDLIAGRIHVLALTSTVQWQRLRQVAGIRLPAMAEAHRARPFLVAAVGRASASRDSDYRWLYGRCRAPG